AKDLRQMLAEALRIGHARCVVLFTIERHTDTLASGWFHGSDSPYGAVCSIHSIGLEVESSYCLHRYSTNHEIRWNQEYADVLGVPFDFTARPVVAPPQPPRETIQVKAVRPERDSLEIRFPRVQGYRVELPEERLTA